jgi:hypothetical protein
VSKSVVKWIEGVKRNMDKGVLIVKGEVFSVLKYAL